MAGGTGKICSCSYLLSRNTKSPRLCSTATAIGRQGKVLTHLRDPGLNGLRHMVHLPALTRPGVGVLQAPDVLLVRPIDGQKSGILDFGLVLNHEFFLTPF